MTSAPAFGNAGKSVGRAEEDIIGSELQSSTSEASVGHIKPVTGPQKVLMQM
jgi:hypothetical protein